MQIMSIALLGFQSNLDMVSLGTLSELGHW